MSARLVFDRPTLRPYGDDLWELAYDWTVVFNGRYYSIPAGTCTDGASIPGWLWWICGHPLKQPRLYAAIVHDFLYDGRDMTATRKVADALYRDMLIALGVGRARAWVEWAALRLLGWRHWQG